MKIKYDKETDIVYIRFIEDVIAESDENKDGIIIDYSKEGKIVGIEILNASRKLQEPGKIEYEAA